MTRRLGLLVCLLLLPSVALAQAPIRVSGTISADEGTVQITSLGYGTVGVQLGGTFTATVVFEISNGAWTTVTCELAAGGAVGVSSATATGMWFCPVSGASLFRVRVSDYTSGTVDIDLVASSGARGQSSVSIVGSATLDTNIVNVPSISIANLVPTSAPTYAVSPCTIVTTASTNATVCADAPANVYGVYYAINTTETPAFMRVINDDSSITCADTPVFVVPIPASSAAGVYGGVALPWVNPINFSTGVGVCVSSGADGTGNAPAGIIILLAVKE